MSLISGILHFAHGFKRARERYLTERQLRSLPTEIQKDIGWPADEDRDLSLRIRPSRH